MTAATLIRRVVIVLLVLTIASAMAQPIIGPLPPR